MPNACAESPLVASAIALAFIAGCSSATTLSPGQQDQLSAVHLEYAALADESQRDIRVPFVLRNVCNHPIEVLDVRPSCSCTNFELTERKVPAQSSVTLTLAIRAAPYERRREIDCVVETTDPLHPRRQFSAVIHINPRLAFEEDAILFGSLRSGELSVAHTHLNVCRKQGEPTHLFHPRLWSSALQLEGSLDYDNVSTTKVGTVCVDRIPATVHFTPTDDHVGVPLCLFASLANAESAEPDATLPIRWAQSSDFEILPRRAIFAIEDGIPPPITISLTRADKRPFKVIDVRPTSALVNATVLPSTDTNTVVQVALNDISDTRHASLIWISTDTSQKVALPVISFRGN